MSNLGVDKIDLLKVDVEGAELVSTAAILTPQLCRRRFGSFFC